MRRKTYRLYAVVYSPGMEERMGKYPVVRFGCGDLYALVYTDKRPQKDPDWHEIKEKDAGALNEAERAWLFECNISILAAEAKAHSADVLRDLSLKVGALEEALREEAEKEVI